MNAYPVAPGMRISACAQRETEGGALFEELGFEHNQWVDGFFPGPFLVVDAFEKAACVRGVDGV